VGAHTQEALPGLSVVAASPHSRSQDALVLADCALDLPPVAKELLKADSRPVVVTTGTGSGKTEAFLLPVIQNALEDATRYRKAGLTAVLVYPMDALANDQRQRISDYLEAAGFGGAVSVARYDRGTSRHLVQGAWCFRLLSTGLGGETTR